MSSFSKVRQKKIYEAVVDQIKDRIASGQLKAGDMLPNEKTLCEAMASAAPRCGRRRGYWNTWALSRAGRGRARAWRTFIPTCFSKSSTTPTCRAAPGSFWN